MKIKRWVAALLCVLLIGSLFPAGAFAADDIASGTGWNLDADGVLHITGHIDESGFDLSDEQKQLVKSAVTESGASISSGQNLFSRFENMTSADLSLLNTTGVPDMSYMFYGCSSLTSLNLSNFNTINVTTMAGMFSGCSSLTSLDVSGFRTDNVTSMIGMFTNCSSLTSLDVSKFETVNVTFMSFMFNGCSSLTSLDLSKFTTGNVTSMAAMFIDCSGLTSLDLSSFDTSSVNNMGGMFSGCSSLTSLDVSGFKTDSLESAEEMFCGCSALTSLGIRPVILFQNADGIIAIRSPWQKQGSTDTYSTADELKAVTDTVTLLAMYTVNVQNDGNGTASANSAAAVKGDTVTLTATPNNGYHFKEWQSSDVTVSNNTFTMPNKEVTVKAAFEAHSFTNYVSDGNATCTKDGTKTAKCDCCDATDTLPDIGSATGHSFTNYVSDGNATCTEDSTKTAKCDYCDETDTVPDIGSATGHNFTNYVSDGNATCTEDGTKTAKCDYCDETDTVPDIGSATGHSFTNYVSDGNATCTEDGTKTAKCDYCDATDTIADAGSFSGHGETEIRDAKAATCTEDGYTGDIYCTVCREKTASGEVIPAAHSWESDFTVDKEASCAEEGSKSIHCTKCDAKKDETAIKKTEHADADFNGKCDGCGTDLSVTYTVIAGADGEWTKGSADGMIFVSDAPFARFGSVKVDGTAIDAANYTAAEGSTKITLAPAYLETLSIGSHSIKIVSKDGSASTNFTVKAAAQPPVPTTYTVSFNMNGHGTQVADQTVEDGNKAIKPADPTASGWTFGGWYADVTFSATFDFNTIVHTNLTLYAKWTENITPPAPTYTIIAETGAEWTKGSKEGLLFTSDADFDKFDSVLVDGNVVAATNYTAVKGSTKITLAPAYLEALSVGSHSIKIVSKDGSASTSFRIKAAPQPTDPTSPKTGDNSHLLLWVLLLSASGAALTGTVIYSIKKKKTN